jgi:hypothetical protein
VLFLPLVMSALCSAPGHAQTAPTVPSLATDPPQVLGLLYRARGRDRLPESSLVTQVMFGMFDPQGDADSRQAIGLRFGPMVDENVHLGLAVDWFRRGENRSTVVETVAGPGGVPIEQERLVSTSSVNHFPVHLFAQFSGSEDLVLVPYGGLSAGYQLLSLHGEDRVTNVTYDGWFSGWGWQGWGGVALPLGARTRLTGEVYVNRAVLRRDTTDPLNGQTVTEKVRASGTGLRAGLAWGF